MYIRKTRDEYNIEGNYGYGWDYIITAEDKKDAKRLLKEYQENESNYPHRIKKHRVKINQ